MKNKLYHILYNNKFFLSFLIGLTLTIIACYYLSLLALFIAILTFGDYYHLLTVITYILYYVIVYFCNRKTIRIKNIALYSIVSILVILWFFVPYYIVIPFIIMLAIYSGWNNRNIRFKIAYLYNVLFVLLYFLITVVGFIVSYYLGFSQSCGYSNEKRIKLNNNFDIINVLYDCGATTSYTNIVYIFPKGKQLSQFERFDKKYEAFSAYRCYSDDLDIKIINDKNIEIQTNCTKYRTYNPLINDINVYISGSLT